MKATLLLLFFLIASFFQCAAFAICDQQCPPQLNESKRNWKGSLRVSALRNIDQFLNWSVSEKLKTFPLVRPLQEQTVQGGLSEVKEFVEKYGYFSFERPIIAKVSSDEKDIQLACCLLKTLYQKGSNRKYLEIATAEVLTKVVAYRDLKAGQKIHIPIERENGISYELYTVDCIIDIWHGMPAFGLLSDKIGTPSILLFRGTDFSLVSERGWASIMSDLDIAGPGLSAFKKSREKISAWLNKAAKENKRARVMGFSLGGALAAYVFIYENALLSDTGSVSICAPGVADSVIEQWNLLSLERQKGFVSYVNEGDIVSIVGRLFGTVYCLSTAFHLKPLTAHTILLCSEPAFKKALVDVSYKTEF